MDNSELAAQLRLPTGEIGIRVAEGMNSSNRELNRLALESLSLQAGEKVLEIGMGNGMLVPDLFAMKDVSYTGVDYSKLMVEKALENNAELTTTSDICFRYAPANDLPFDDLYFNKIFCVNVIYFWDNPEMELQEINRVMKHDGIFAIAIRTRESMQKMPFTTSGFTLYSQEDLESLMLRNGFRLYDTKYKVEVFTMPDGQDFRMENLVMSFKKLFSN